uniref:Uncharacterized protein n=1 Tax=Avena sativa TaxID=4498 RepID=A0ACD5XVS5_AVESA
MESSRAARGGGSWRPPAGRTPSPAEVVVKVKHIITRKVSADEASFKDVVQRLTGKDSAAARAQLLLGARHDSSIARTTTAAPLVVAAAGVSVRNNVDAEGSAGAGAGFNAAGTAVSFQDTLLPSLEEMDRWWGSHHGLDSYAARP